MPPRSRSSWNWKAYRRLQLLLNGLPLLGLAIVLYSLRANYRDRQSLQWPSVAGTVMQSEAQQYRHGKYGGWEVNISYRYQVNEQRYVGNRISLWDPKGHRRTKYESNTFVANNPARSTVTVCYDPQHPENAVLEPGADEETNRIGIWCGSIIFACGVYLTWRINRFFNKLVAWRKANPPRLFPSHRHEKREALVKK